MTIDLDQLLAPIDNAPAQTDARRAVWEVLRLVKCRSWWQRGKELRDIIAAIDAAAWQAGLSERFRTQSIGAAYEDCYHGSGNGMDSYPVIPDNLPEMISV